MQKRKWTRQEQENWRANTGQWLFYSNPDDASLLVRKSGSYRISYTLNFGNKYAWCILVGGSVFSILLPLFLLR